MSEDDDDDDDEEEGEGANEDREDGASTNINNRTVRVSDECLALVFENLLKLLQQSSPVELAHNTSQLLRLLAAQPSSDGAPPPPESSAGDIQVSEAAISESWHDAPVSLSTSVCVRSLAQVAHFIGYWLRSVGFQDAI